MGTKPSQGASATHRGMPGRLESALARAEATEAMYRTLVDRLPAIVTYTEALDDGRTLSISPQIEALLGCPRTSGWRTPWYG